MRMKTGFILLPIVLAVLLTGCVRLNKAILNKTVLPPSTKLAGQKLPEPFNVITNLPGLARLIGETNVNTHLSKTNLIPDANGILHQVIINYSDINSPHFISLGGAVKTVFGLSKDLLNLKEPTLSPVYKPGLRNLILLPQEFAAFQSAAFQNELNTNLRNLIENQLKSAAGPLATNVVISVSLDAILAAYLRAYLDGTFVDRWGTPLSQPDLMKIGDDTASPVTTVMLEAFFDYSLMTPIVYDPSQSSTSKTPTFAIVFPQLYQPISANPDTDGITVEELQAIHYLSGVSAEGAKHLSSLLLRFVGGAAFGVKISTGDNATLAQIVSTLCDEVSRRTTEDLTYKFFEEYKYFPTNNELGFAAEPANEKNLHIDSDANNAVIALLTSQDYITDLLHGGWKSSMAELTNVSIVMDKLRSPTNGPFSAYLFGLLSTNSQALVKQNHPLSPAQQQQILDDLMISRKRAQHL